MTKKERRYKTGWKTRTRGTPAQVGSKFNTLRPTKSSLPHNLKVVVEPSPAWVMSTDKSSKYVDYVRDSLHGNLRVNKHSEPIKLSLITVREGQLDSMTSKRADFEESVQYHIDEIRNGKTISPILIHRLANGRYAVLDGNARVEAYRRLGIHRFPAVENSILGAIGKGISTVVRVGARAVKTGAKAGIEAGRILAPKIAGAVKTGAKAGYDVAHTSARAAGKAGAIGYKASSAVARGVGHAYAGYENIKSEYQWQRIEPILKDAESDNPIRRRVAISHLKRSFPDVYRQWVEERRNG